VIRFLLFFFCAWLFVSVVLPLGEIVLRSLRDKHGSFVGFANFRRYFASPALSSALYNSLFVSILTTLISVPLGFSYAFALTHTRVRWRAFFQVMAMAPLFAPTMMHGIALRYLFGNKGAVTTGLFGLFERFSGVAGGLDIGLYGPVGIVIAETIYTFPQVVMIMTVALLVGDARLNEAAETLGSNKLKTFLTVTLPGVKYGLLNSVVVSFILCFTDFGAPKVVGGNYRVLAVDIYSQVVGQQNFVMGATISIILLIPSVIAFAADRVIQRKQAAMLTSRAVPLAVRENKPVDRAMFVFCLIVSASIGAVLLSVLAASLIRVWPYDFALGLRYYNFASMGGGGLGAFGNSVVVSTLTAVFGTVVTFSGAYLIEKADGLLKTGELRWARQLAYFLSVLPLALPGLVIGLAYIFFFNRPHNPLHFVYRTMAILVLANVVHFYSVCFLTAATALKKLDREFEVVSKAMSVPLYKTFFSVTLPVCLPAVMEIMMYYFVNSMATISAVIFLYAPHLKLASVAVVNMDDAGDTAPAAAMSVLILGANVLVRVLYSLAMRGIKQKTELWTKR
jgi:iron(III) transport system permease protein